MGKYGKFAVLMAIIIGSLLWLATASVTGSKTYYVTIPELRKMGADAGRKRVRVGGDVQKDSIVRASDGVHFNLVQDTQILPVVYEGRDPLPDTFKPGAQALAGGKIDSAGVFHAQEVQAKCASKYAPKPGVAPEGLQKQVAPTGSYKS
jgi:cytochrome c-type biogenesis protein CcmE